MKLVILSHFLPFIPLKTPKIKILKNKKIYWIFHKRAPKITIISCMVPETKSETDKIFCHFGSFFALLHPPNDPEYQNFEKNEKKCLEILFFCTYMCIINKDHMIYGS